MCMVDDSDGWEFFTETYVKAARKEHRCDECARTIRAGESYRKAFGVYGGMTHDYETCAHCLVAMEWLNKACQGYLFSAVLEDLREHYDEHESYRSPVLLALIEGMSAGWHGGADPVPDKEAVRASVPSVAA